MDQLLTSLPSTFLGWVSSLLIIFGGVIVLFNRLRNEDLKTLRNSNDDLRHALQDNEKRMDNLQNSVQFLKERVMLLESEKKTIQDLVLSALESYFMNNPQEAMKTKTRVRSKTTITEKIT